MTDFRERYKLVDKETDGLLDRIKASQWTPLIIMAVVVGAVIVGIFIGAK